MGLTASFLSNFLLRNTQRTPKKMSDETVKVTVNIPKEMNRRLKKGAEKRFISKAAFARQIFAEHIEQQGEGGSVAFSRRKKGKK